MSVLPKVRERDDRQVEVDDVRCVKAIEKALHGLSAEITARRAA